MTPLKGLRSAFGIQTINIASLRDLDPLLTRFALWGSSPANIARTNEKGAEKFLCPKIRLALTLSVYLCLRVLCVARSFCTCCFS